MSDESFVVSRAVAEHMLGSAAALEVLACRGGSQVAFVQRSTWANSAAAAERETTVLVAAR